VELPVQGLSGKTGGASLCHLLQILPTPISWGETFFLIIWMIAGQSLHGWGIFAQEHKGLILIYHIVLSFRVKDHSNAKDFHQPVILNFLEGNNELLSGHTKKIDKTRVNKNNQFPDSPQNVLYTESQREKTKNKQLKNSKYHSDMMSCR